MLLPHREAFYGGAAGGGKSDAILMAGLQYVDFPEYSGIIFRRTYQDLALPGAIMERSHHWLDHTDARWSEIDKRWTFPSGATLSFGYLEYERQKYRYQSAEFNFVAFDELTQFTETQYLYLLSRLRRGAGVRIPSRMRSGANPGGIGHEWVKARFVDPGDPSRPFIPSLLDDNPHLDQEDYEASLAELDPVTRRQLRHGDWGVAPEGNTFKRGWFPLVDASPIDAQARVRWWDLAATEPKKEGEDPDWTAGLLLARTKTGLCYVEDVVRIRDTPGMVEATIRQTAELDGLGIEICMEQEPGASGKTVIHHYRDNVLPDFAFRGFPSSGDKRLRANPVSAQAEAGNIRLVRGPWTKAFLEELVLFPRGAHDDQVDALSGAYQRLAKRRKWSAA